MICPGFCAIDHEIGAPTGICHECSEPNPQETDGATAATTELRGAPHALSCYDTVCGDFPAKARVKILWKGLAFETPNEKATEASDSAAKPDPQCFIVEATEQPLEDTPTKSSLTLLKLLEHTKVNTDVCSRWPRPESLHRAQVRAGTSKRLY